MDAALAAAIAADREADARLGDLLAVIRQKAAAGVVAAPALLPDEELDVLCQHLRAALGPRQRRALVELRLKDRVVTCHQLGTIMAAHVSPAEKIALARGLRGRIVDPNIMGSALWFELATLNSEQARALLDVL